MNKFLVDGGKSLKGEVKISGSKNAATKMIAASLLTAEEVVLDNVPQIGDVETILTMVRKLGGEAVWIDENKLRLVSPTLTDERLTQEITRTTRGAVALMAPMLVRFGRFSICAPGGDNKIGLRPINRHLEALAAFGAEIEEKEGCFIGQTRLGLKGAEINFKKITVMGTETAILAAVRAEGKTLITNAAAEPEVDALIAFLNQMGAKIYRSGERRIEIEGVTVLHGSQFSLPPDRIEAATFAVAAAVTGGEVDIQKIIPAHLTAFLAKLQKVGVNYEVGKESLRIWGSVETSLRSTDVETSPYPGFMTDWQSPFCVLLTQAAGVGHLHETIYLNRFEYTKELNRMGAKIEILKPSQGGFKARTDEEYDLEVSGEPLTLARITGPTPLAARRLNIPDLRAGATLVLAALAARGQSEILGLEEIDRGYENFEVKLAALGAKIERISS